MPLALRLTGKFTTAFPEGVKEDEKKPAAPGTPALRESPENSVIVVADVDMLADGAAVDIQDVFGRKVVVPSNGNLAFALGMVEQFAAGDELISLRSRAGAFRPLTVVRELEAEAQKEYFGKIQALEEEAEDPGAPAGAAESARRRGERRANPIARAAGRARGASRRRMWDQPSAEGAARWNLRTPRRSCSGPRSRTSR